MDYNCLIENYINEYNKKIDLLSPQELDNCDINIIHHIWRCVLQTKNFKQVEIISKQIQNKQCINGSWLKDNEESVGITIATIYRLLWSIYILDENNLDIKNLINSIKKGIEYFTPLYGYVFKNDVDSAHGKIDAMHYYILTCHYIIKFNKKYHLSNKKNLKIINSSLNECINFLKINQANDGGWHEIDRLRYRVGTTSDALRGLIIDKNSYENIILGCQFICNNQNPYKGYWCAGNIDKVSDALKVLLDVYSKYMELRPMLSESIDIGMKWLCEHYSEYLILEENYYDILTIFIDYNKIFLKQEKLCFY